MSHLITPGFHRRPLHHPRKAGPTLLVAATGGHLEELVRLRDRMQPSPGPCEWVTFADEQSASLLAGEQVHLIDYIPPRDYGGVMRALPTALRILRQGHHRSVISTGSGVALPFFAAGRLLGVPCHYIESAARPTEPSLTGRVAGVMPGVQLHSQYPSQAGGRWLYGGSLFDGFVAEPQPPAVVGAHHFGLSRVVVTLGTMRTYGFRRAVERLTEILPQVCRPDADIVWQTGATDLADLGVPGQPVLPASTLRQAIAAADLVVAHAGVGSALTALDAGRCPVLLPRRAAHGEHVDDHQVLISQALDRRGLAVAREVNELTPQDLLRAADTSVHSAGRPPAFDLAADH